MHVKTCTCRSRMRATRCRKRIKLQRGNSPLDTSSSPPPIPLPRRNQSSSDATLRLRAAESHFPVVGGFLLPVAELRPQIGQRNSRESQCRWYEFQSLVWIRNQKRSSAMSTNRTRNPIQRFTRSQLLVVTFTVALLFLGSHTACHPTVHICSNTK